jgi:hypothetical protein
MSCGGKRVAATFRAGLQALQLREYLKELVREYPFTFPNVLNAGMLITIFTLLLSNPYLGCSNFSTCSCKIHVNKNSVKFLQGVNFSQLPGR